MASTCIIHGVAWKTNMVYTIGETLSFFCDIVTQVPLKCSCTYDLCTYFMSVKNGELLKESFAKIDVK